MAEDIQSNIRINVDTAAALANIKSLQGQLSAFYTQMAKSGAAASASVAGMQNNFVNALNMSGKYRANIETIRSSTEAFNTSLEKNKLSLNQYFRYAVASSKSFGKAFTTEYETINKVAVERVKDIQTQYIKMGRDASGAMKAIAVRPLSLDMENLSTKTQIAAQKQQLLNQLLKQGSTNLLNWGKNTQWAGRQLMVGFSIPLMMAGSAATKAYQEIEKASIKISRVYGDLNTTAQETSAMVDQIKNLAAEYTKYGVAVADTMQMAADAAAMGKTGADLLAQVNAATRLSVLGGVDQAKALETSISLTNAFGISSSQLANKINYLNSVENQTVLNIEDMTTALPKAAPVVKQLGGDVEDLAFMLTAMKEGGVNASEGANAIKSGLSSLINPTKKASDFLKGFGIDVSGIVQKDKGNLRKTVVDFAKALNTLDPLNRAKAIEMMFGKFQFSRMSTMLKNVTNESSQAAKALELANMSGIQRAAMARKELDKMESSPLFKFQKAMADLQLKLAPIGETFLKAITPVVTTIGGILDKFDKLSDGAKSFVIGTIAVIGGLAPVLLMTIGLVANGAANIMKFFASLKSFFNKTTTASETLGETTSYMTQEQIKAEAVAASLDQVHSKLKQTFTSEAEAVNLYTSALKRAVEASQALNGAPATPRASLPVVPMPYKTAGKLPKGNAKFAEGGIISGPGTGTSDSIHAMLSDGEAVIPAKSVAKNRGLVEQLISGDVPGFAYGGMIGGNRPGYVSKLNSSGGRWEGNKYVSAAQLAARAQRKAELEAQAKTPEGQARQAELNKIAKSKRPPLFLYNPAVAGDLHPDHPLLNRMVRDQFFGNIGFVSDDPSIKFLSDPNYKMARDAGLKEGRYQVIPTKLVRGLGDGYNVSVYGSMGGVIKRYASGGVIGGPGTGTSDSIPAMVSNGEAIIPAKTVKKFPGLVHGLVSGKIGHFATGKDGVDFAHIGGGYQITAQKILVSETLSLAKSIRNQIEQLVRVVPDAVVNLKHAWGTQMDSATNRELGKKRGADIDAVANQFTGKDINSRYGEMAKLAGADLSSGTLASELADYDASMSAKINQLKEAGIRKIVDTDKQLSQLTAEEQKFTASLETIDNEIVSNLSGTHKELASTRQKAIGTVRDIRIGEGLSVTDRENLLADPEASKVLGKNYDKGTKRRIWRSHQSKGAGGFGTIDQESMDVAQVDSDKLIKHQKEKAKNLEKENKQSQEIQAVQKEEIVATQESVQANKKETKVTQSVIQAEEQQAIAIKEDAIETAAKPAARKDGLSPLGLPLSKSPTKPGFSSASGFKSINQSGAISATQAEANLRASRSPIKNYIADSMKNAGPNFAAEMATVKAEGRAILTEVKTTFSGAKSEISSTANIIKTSVKGTASSAMKSSESFQYLKSAMTMAAANLRAEAPGLRAEWQQIIAPMKPTLDAVKNKFTEVFNAIRTTSLSIVPRVPGPIVPPGSLMPGQPSGPMGMNNPIVQNQVVTQNNWSGVTIAKKYMQELQVAIMQNNAAVRSAYDAYQARTALENSLKGKILAGAQALATAAKSAVAFAKTVPTTVASAFTKMKTSINSFANASLAAAKKFGTAAKGLAVKAGAAFMRPTIGDAFLNPKVGKVVGALGKMGAALTAATFAASMFGGPVGELANQLMPLIFAASALAPLLGGLKVGMGELIAKYGEKRQAELAAIALEKEAAAAKIINTGATNTNTGAKVANTGSTLGNTLSKIGNTIATWAANAALWALSLPLWPVVAGITLLAAGIAIWVTLSNQANEQRKKELAESRAGLKAQEDARKAMSAFGQLTGTDLQIPSIASAQVKAISSTGRQEQDIQSLLKSEDFTNKDKEVYKLIKDIKGMTDVKAKSFITGLAQSFVAGGMDKESVDSVIKAIQIAAGKQNLELSFAKIDVSTKTGMKTVAKTIADNVAAAADKNLSQWQRGKRITESIGSDPEKMKALTPQQRADKGFFDSADFDAYVKKANDAKAAKTDFQQAIVDLNAQLGSGAITAKTYGNTMKEIGTNINNTVDSKGKLENLIGTMGGSDAKEAAVGLNNVNQELTLFAILSSDAAAGNAIITGLKGTAEQAAAAKAKLESYSAVFKIVKDTYASDSTDPNAGGGTTTKPIDTLTSALKDLADTQLTNKLIAQGFTQDFASSIASMDKKTRAFYGTTLKNGTFQLNEHGKQLKAAFDKKIVEDFSVSFRTKMQDFAAQTQLLNALRIEFMKQGLTLEEAATAAADSSNIATWKSAQNSKTKKDEIAKIVALLKQEKALEEAGKTATQRSVEALQKQADLQQANIDKLSADNGMGVMQDKIDVYNDALNIISMKEDVINKKYDERSKALDDIQKSQDAIENSQKDQLTIADAISKGDIAAAAKAAQDARQSAAQRAMDDQKNALETAKQTELDSITQSINGKLMTRKTIEAEINTIQAKMYDIQLNVLDVEKSKLAVINEQLAAKQAMATIETNTTLSTTSATTTATSLDYQQAVIALTSGRATSAQKKLLGMSMGGMIPSYFANGSLARGTDTVPAMLTPGEFIMSRGAVQKYGLGIMDKINSGALDMPTFDAIANGISGSMPVALNSSNVDNSSVYNNTYSININADGNADTESIARAVVNKIRQYDSQYVRGVRV